MTSDTQYHNCRHKLVEPNMKRILVGVSDNNFTFQTTILPNRILATEILYQKNDFTCGIRWHSESNRKVAVWYKNLKFECSINKKDTWAIKNCIDNSVLLFMKNQTLYKNYDDYKSHCPINKTTEAKTSKKELTELCIQDDNELYKQFDCQGNFEEDLNEDIPIEYTNDKLVDLFIQNNYELYKQINNKVKFEEELYNEISTNYVEYIEDKMYVKNAQSFFQNFIFAEQNIANFENRYTYENVTVKNKDLLKEKSDWVKSALRDSLNELYSEDYIYICDTYLYSKIYKKLAKKWADLIEEISMKKDEENFVVFFNKTKSAYHFEYYWNRFYGILEQGIVIKSNKDILNSYFNYHNKLQLMKSNNLSEYKLIYKTLYPLYEKYILTKKKKIRPIILKMREHLEYFKNIVSVLYKNSIIKDVRNSIEVYSYENLNKIKIEK